MENEWFCTKCRSVVIGKDYKCCGTMEKFDPQKHGRSLISSSNAWINLWGNWDKHPLMRQVSDELTTEGTYSAWIIFSEFIRRLEQKEA